MQMQLIVLQILTEVFKNKDLEQCWSHFVELLTLRVLSVYSDEKKDVSHIHFIVLWLHFGL